MIISQTLWRALLDFLSNWQQFGSTNRPACTTWTVWSINLAYSAGNTTKTCTSIIGALAWDGQIGAARSIQAMHSGCSCHIHHRMVKRQWEVQKWTPPHKDESQPHRTRTQAFSHDFVSIVEVTLRERPKSEMSRLGTIQTPRQIRRWILLENRL